ncbi:toprim domain-containing protein [Candidatus Bathyarchaeota archaeon]|nr:toprim domain-containing protein [Candidatus Bathyarchaeota archaeon]
MPRINRQEVLDILKKLIENIESTEIILVEGIKDVKAIRKLGFKGRIEVCLHQKTTLTDISTLVGGRGNKVVILTDFDQEGNNLNDRLSRLILSTGAIVNVGFRIFFGKALTSVGIREIEGIDNLID